MTDELKAQALEVASLYEPLAPPVLVGSCAWLGEGNDIDVVILVKDRLASCGGDPGCSVDYVAFWPTRMTYRHGVVNVIAVDCAVEWEGWKHAAAVMPSMPKSLMQDKSWRVSVCEELRLVGKAQCQFA